MRLKNLSLALLPLALVAATPAFADDVTADLQLSGQVMPGCELNVPSLTDLEWGGLIVTAQTSRAVIARCNVGTAYTIAAGDGLGHGLNPEYSGYRTLTGDAYQLPYRLFRGQGQPGSLEEWGDGANVFSGVGDGEPQFHAYSLSIYDVHKAPSGVYADTVEITLTY